MLNYPRHTFLPFVCGIFLLGFLLVYLGSALLVVMTSTEQNFFICAGSLLIAFSLLLYGAWLLRRCGVGGFSLVIYIAAAVISLHYIHISNNEAYTNDLGGHLARIAYTKAHWLAPYSYNEWQEHHPPVYYYVGALIMHVTELLNVPFLTAIRFFSWICFLILNAFALLTLSRVKMPALTHHISAGLLLLWPAGLHLASKISPEPMYYAFYAASFYYLVCWYQQNAESDLMRAILIAGLALSVRTNAILLFILVLIFAAVVYGRDRFLITPKRWIGVIMVVAVCALINTGRIFLKDMPLDVAIASQFGTPCRKVLTATHFLFISIHDSLSKPFVDWSGKQSFWDAFFKTSLFGEYTWSSPNIAASIYAVALCLAVYTIVPWLFASRRQWQGMLPFVLGLAVPLMLLIYFAIQRCTIPNEDARYIYPSLVCFVVLFGKSHVMYKERGTLVLSWLGSILALLLALLSTFYFWTNFR